MSTQAIEFLQHDLAITSDDPPELTPEELSVEAAEFLRQGNLPPVLPRGLVADRSSLRNGALALQNAIEKAWQVQEQPASEVLPIEGAPDESEHLADDEPIEEADYLSNSDDEPAWGPARWLPRARISSEAEPEPLYSRQHDLRTDLGMLMRAGAVVVVLIMVVAFARTATAAEETTSDPGLISVSGIGEVTATPDLAVITTGVVTSAPTAREAVTANTEAMNGILKRLKDMGIEDRDLQTSNFSINPQYQHFRSQNGQPTPPPRIVAYEVRNTLRVRIRDLDSTGTILDAVVSDGANEVSGISFSIDDPTSLMQTARKRAVFDARSRAEVLADSLDVELGRVVSVSEGQRPAPVPQPRMARMEMAMAAEAGPVTVEAGEQSLTATVTITWEIEQ
ncbi:MAG: SIMPL domain-containing protein [Pseudomonadota bacterium]